MLIYLITKGGRSYGCGEDPAVTLESKTAEVEQARLNNDFVTCSGMFSVDAHEVEAISSISTAKLIEFGVAKEGSATGFAAWLQKRAKRNP